MSSQQHCLSSKFCSCSKAWPNKPMLRPEQRAPHLFQIPSNPDLPMIRCTKHIRGPLPGKLTNQSCKVRKCVLGQTSLVKTGQRWAVRNCQEHGIQLVPLETSDLCPSSSAKLSAQRSGAATQRSSKLCSATLSRCRSPCKDWSSVKLTSEDLFVWHIPTSTIINHPHLIHHPSS